VSSAASRIEHPVPGVRRHQKATLDDFGAGLNDVHQARSRLNGFPAIIDRYDWEIVNVPYVSKSAAGRLDPTRRYKSGHPLVVSLKSSHAWGINHTIEFELPKVTRRYAKEGTR
jgi:hypothetical protein